MATRIIDTPEHGRRWLDLCRTCYLTAAKKDAGPPEPFEDTATLLLDALRELGLPWKDTTGQI
ncbi:hypothetical protein ACIQNU_04620 [Streptomyces sp. NPDC091292]|uniref:hypothetical protein n=1 Tax=Streptomyces sp. NPDC091292 TaxID=3365991 RepID=UPI003822C181